MGELVTEEGRRGYARGSDRKLLDVWITPRCPGCGVPLHKHQRRRAVSYECNNESCPVIYVQFLRIVTDSIADKYDKSEKRKEMTV